MDELLLQSKSAVRAGKYWRIAQVITWLAGMFLLYALLFSPATGLLLFWNVLIPVAPALFVFAAGLWRNICPLATTTLLPRHLGFSTRKKITAKASGILGLMSVLMLYIIVPLRHAVFNNNGTATAFLIILAATAGVIGGFFYEWKSVWCSGLCPVHPVEKLYGNNVIASLANAHCTNCMNCVVPCPDSTPHIHPLSASKTRLQKISGYLITGGLPGFIWGWFHVPDEKALMGLNDFFSVYTMPAAGLLVSMAVYMLLIALVPPFFKTKLGNIFAAASVSCYYWFRIPSLFGFGKFATDGLLVDLHGFLPAWTVLVVTMLTTACFFYWLVLRRQNKTSWVIRPAFGLEKAASYFQG